MKRHPYFIDRTPGGRKDGPGAKDYVARFGEKPDRAAPGDVAIRMEARFIIPPDGSWIRFQVAVENAESVAMAHLHLGPPGHNGPRVVWLFPPTPPAQVMPGRFTGVLAAGVIRGRDLVRPLDGQPLDDLVAAMESGNTYVHVHTVHFPEGEIRGQVLPDRDGPGEPARD